MSCPSGLSPGFGLPRPERSSLCQICTSFGTVGTGELLSFGTGFYFRGRSGGSRILTAGHNLYNHDLAVMATLVYLRFERDGDTWLAERTKGRLAVPAAFSSASTPVREWDFGVIRLDLALAPDRFRPIPLATAKVAGETRKLIVGYPNAGDCEGSGNPYCASFTVFPDGPANYGYGPQETYIGMSGAPLLGSTPDDLTVRAYGLHIRGDQDPERGGVRFTTTVQAAINAL